MSETEKRPFIVAGLDGSDQSIHATQWAIAHAPGLGAEVHVVGAWFVPSTIFFTPIYIEADYGRDAENAFDKAYQQVLAGVDASHTRITLSMIRQHARKALVELSKGAEALVIGSHSHGNRYPGMHLGSTASYLVHHATCPVIVVPPAAPVSGT